MTKDSKLIAILKTFSPKELKKFGTFIVSPYFNKNETIIAYIHYLAKLSPQWNEAKLTDEAQFKAVFPKENFEKQKLYYLRSDATELLETFLVQEYHNMSSTEHQFVLLDYYLKQNMGEYFELGYQKWRTAAEKEQIRDGQYYYDCFKMNWLEIVYQEMMKQRKGNFNYQEQRHLLDIFYLINTLSLHISTLSTGEVLSIKENASLQIEKLLNYIETGDGFFDIPMIQLLYHHMKMLLTPDDEELVTKSLTILDNNLNRLPQHTLTAMFSIIRNRYIAYINKGQKIYEKKLFHLYQKQISSNIIYDSKNEIPVGVFINIITLGLREAEYEWVVAFINNYAEKLPENYRQSTIYFAWAKYHFSLKNYSLVLQELIKMENYPDVFTDINARKLLSQTYYALNEIDNVANTLNSFRVFLSRNKNLSEKNKDFYLNFAIAMNKLITLDTNDKQKVENFHVFIDELNPPEKSWFIEQVTGYV